MKPSVRPGDNLSRPEDTGDRDESGCECDPVDEAQGGVSRDGPDRAEGDAEELPAVEEIGEVAASPSVVRPCTPTHSERKAHEATHCPFRSWCLHCVRGQAAEYPHRSVGADAADGDVARVSMDYCYFNEDVRRETTEHVDSEVAVTSLTLLVMKETQFGSI